MTFKRPTSAGWAVLAIGALFAVGFVDAALPRPRRPRSRCRQRLRGPAASPQQGRHCLDAVIQRCSC